MIWKKLLWSNPCYVSSVKKYLHMQPYQLSIVLVLACGRSLRGIKFDRTKSDFYTLAHDDLISIIQHNTNERRMAFSTTKVLDFNIPMKK